MTPAIRYTQKRLTSTGEKRIYWKHAMFAERAASYCVKNGMTCLGMRIPPIVEAYLWAYPKAKSRAGARACSSRLWKRRDVRAAVHWFYAVQNGEVPRGIAMPETPSGIRAELEKAGSWRAKYVPVPPKIIVMVGGRATE